MNMRTLISTTISLSVLSVSLLSIDSFAQGHPPGGKRGPAHGERMTIQERLDTDGDGILGLEEFSTSTAGKASRHFDRKDADSDGVLSLEEFSTSGRHGRHPSPDSLDTDALELCMKEILGYELPERPESETAFGAADTDADGWVNVDEFLAANDLRTEERFAEIDEDGDWALTDAELGAYGEEKRERRDAHRTCVAEQMDEDDILN